MQDYAACKVSCFAGTKPTLFPLKREIRKILLVMKITAILLLVATLHVSAKGWGQEKISLSFNNAPLAQVFNSITSQAGVSFFYRPQYVKDKTVTINVTNADLKTVLDLCLKNQELSYEIVGKTVAVHPVKQNTLSNAQVGASTPPLIDVRGRVVNERGEPVEGVTVIIKGTNLATTTDKNGEFRLSNIDKDAVLIFTSVNMETFEWHVSGKTELAIKLRTRVIALDDVTVTVNTGYEKVPKERATGSFEFVTKEELNRRVGTNILNRLEGVATGIFFDKRNLPASQSVIPVSNITIRGLSTLTTSPATVKQPLIILNNFPYDGNIDNINPNDIESVTILKDAAAASIYGARAANGVIVITTKQGTSSKALQVSLNSNVIISSKPDLFHYPGMTSSEFIEAETFLFNKGFFNGALNSKTYLAVSPVIEVLANRRSGLISSADSALQINTFKNLDVRNDFNKYVYRKSALQTYFLNLNGGNELVKYNIGLGFDKNLNTLIGNQDRRLTLSSENIFTPSKAVTINLGVRLTNTVAYTNSLGELNSQNYKFRNGARSLLPYEQFVDANGNYLPVIRDYRNGYIDTAGHGGLLNWEFNPLDEAHNISNRSDGQDVLVNGIINLKLTKALNFSTKYQYQKYFGVNRINYTEESYYVRNLINLYTNLNATDPALRNPIPLGGILDQRDLSQSSHYGAVQVNFDKTWNRKHQVTGFGGTEIREVVAEINSHRRYGYDADKLSTSLVDFVNQYPQYGNRGNQLIPTGPNGDSKTTDHFVSAFANAAYSYDRRYVFSASIRKDAANLFGVDINDKWKPFWSVGLGWNVSNESFFKVKKISYLKLRATYGYQGNVNNSLAPYTIINYGSAASSPYNMPFATISAPANPGLSWENVKQINAGIDLRLLKDRIAASIDVYHKSSDNLILSSDLDPTTGVFSTKRNGAGISGKGIDLSLTTINIQSVLSWITELKLSTIKNRVTKTELDITTLRAENVVNTNSLNITTRDGITPYAIFSYRFAGLDPATGNPQGYLGKSVSSDYRGIFEQLSDTANLIYHGSAIPTLFGYLNNNFSFKGATLSIGISYSFGYYFRKNAISYYSLYQNGVQHRDYSKKWIKPGDEQKTNVPSMIYPLSDSRRDDFYAFSSVNVLKGDNIRLQYINLSYDLTKFLIKKALFKSIQIYSNVENLGLLWKANKEGLDPDWDNGNALYPPVKRFAAGIRLEL
jgi:TonB-linked SusC/RagA family outer membrane protein